jgi:hypothetical protein
MKSTSEYLESSDGRKRSQLLVPKSGSVGPREGYLCTRTTGRSEIGGQPPGFAFSSGTQAGESPYPAIIPISQHTAGRTT